MKTIEIQTVMTRLPHSIGPKQNVHVAKDLMQEHNLRHLPVLSGGRLLGVVTDRDVKLAGGMGEQKNLSVEDIMSPWAYEVSPSTSLEVVVREMSEKKLGCTIVTDHSKVVGILTVTDALRVLADLIHKKH